MPRKREEKRTSSSSGDSGDDASFEPMSRADGPEWMELTELAQDILQQGDFRLFLTSSYRIKNEALRKSFLLRKGALRDNGAASKLLVYSNNVVASADAASDGFANLEQDYLATPLLFAKHFAALPIEEGTVMKFLVCEVAVGRSQRGEGPDTQFDPRAFDSRIVEGTAGDEWLVYNPHQALPRYVLSCMAHARDNLEPLCDTHRGHPLNRWCLTCRRAVCEFCVESFHKNHSTMLIRAAAEKRHTALSEHLAQAREMMQRLKTTISAQESCIGQLEDAKRDAKEAIEDQMDTLHEALDWREEEAIRQSTRCAEEALKPVLTFLNTINPIADALRDWLNTAGQLSSIKSKDNVRQALHFLEQEPAWAPIEALVNSAPPNPPPLVQPSLPTTLTLLSEAEGIIEDISLQTQAGSPYRMVTDSEKVDMIERGHLWSVQNAKSYLSAGVAADLLSDAFSLGGQMWELRVAIPAKGPIGIFLHAAGHEQRIDFDLCIVAAQKWRIRRVDEWPSDFAGKGWGVNPFISREEALKCLGAGSLKVLVAPRNIPF